METKDRISIKVEDCISLDNPLTVLVKSGNLRGYKLVYTNTIKVFKYPEVSEGELLSPEEQTELADAFISIASSVNGISIETHSDYIINRIVRRIVEDGMYDKYHELSEKIDMYFIVKEDDDIVFKKIGDGSEIGAISWPDGFFDQLNKEQKIILDTCNERVKRIKELEKNDT